MFGLANNRNSVYSVWPLPLYQSLQKGQYRHFGLLVLAKTLIWPPPKRPYQCFGQNQQTKMSVLALLNRLIQPYFCLISPAKTHIWVCLVLQIPRFSSIWSGQYPNFSLFCLANTQILVCLVWRIPTFGLMGLANTHVFTFWSGKNSHFCLSGLANNHILFCLVRL